MKCEKGQSFWGSPIADTGDYDCGCILGYDDNIADGFCNRSESFILKKLKEHERCQGIENLKQEAIYLLQDLMCIAVRCPDDVSFQYINAFDHEKEFRLYDKIKAALEVVNE